MWLNVLLPSLLCLTLSSSFVQAFSVISSSNKLKHYGLSMSTQTSEAAEEAVGEGKLLKRDRYVAMNRFTVREEKEAKFEQRWATRKSRLATLDGFRYFHLMRRVKLGENGTCSYDGQGGEHNYMSFTVWKDKDSFDAWRKSDAFKEAHGGTSIGAFLSAMVNSMMVLQGPPRVALYDALLVQSALPEPRNIVDGWRGDVADMESLPVESFVACNQFYIPPENAVKFEQMWATRKSMLKECDGFVAFLMMRREGANKDEPTYLSTTIWRDRAAFDGWRTGIAFQVAHADANSKKTEFQKPLWTKPASPVFFEGKLVISCEEGI